LFLYAGIDSIGGWLVHRVRVVLDARELRSYRFLKRKPGDP